MISALCPATMYISGLPSDIFLEVIELMDVPTLLNLRLVNKSICQLIDSYEASLSTAVAKNYQWITDFDYDPPDTQISTIKQLHQYARLDLIREVAMHEQARPVTAMCTQTYQPAVGEELTRRLKQGIATYQRFLEITKDAQATEVQQRKSARLGWLSLSLNTPVVVEFCHRDYVKGLSSADVFNYMLLFYFVDRFSFPALPCVSRHKGAHIPPAYLNLPDDDGTETPDTQTPALGKRSARSPIGRIGVVPNKIVHFLSTPLHIEHYKSRSSARQRSVLYAKNQSTERIGAIPKQRGCKAPACAIKGPLQIYSKIRILRSDELNKPKEFLQETIGFTRKLLAMTGRESAVPATET